jgi:Aldo/keto reductases, related to diketogulonate reductase
MYTSVYSTPTVTLVGGDEMPVVGFGTWDLSGQAVTDSVRTALQAGYEHIDTAEGYENETEVREAITDHDREDLFLTTKVLPKHLNYNAVIESCENSLNRLGTDYVDLYLVHWPNPAISIRETMDAMDTLHERGMIRNVGVCNFSSHQLRAAQHVSDVPVATNQVEFHPWLPQTDLRAYCDREDIALIAAAPLGRTRVLADDVIRDIADARARSPAQVVLRWELEKGVATIPKSSSSEHIEENFDLFGWELTDEEIARIDDIEHEERIYWMTNMSDDTYGIPE